MCAAQLTGYGYLIYGEFSWDTIEPITYLTTAFYSSVGMIFYLRNKENFRWSSARGLFEKKKLKKLREAHKVDSTRIEFLERYVKMLKA